MVGHYPTIES